MSAIRRFDPSVASIGSAQPVQATTSHAATSAKAGKVNLFDISQLTTPTTVKLSNGSAITLPAMSNEEASQVQSLFAGLTGDQQDSVNSASEQLGQALFHAMQNNLSQPAHIDTSDDDDGGSQFAAPAAITRLATGAGGTSRAAVQSATGTGGTASSPYTSVSQATPVTTAAGSVSAATTHAMSTYDSVQAGQPYDNQIMATTYMGISGLQSQMTTYAQGMQERQGQKSAISADATELRQAVADWPTGTHTNAAGDQVITMTYHEAQTDGSVTTVTKDLTKAQATAAADGCDSLVSSMGDQSELDQIKLQSMSQNYSNAVNMMSNLMKASYDTIKNTLGNIHY